MLLEVIPKKRQIILQSLLHNQLTIEVFASGAHTGTGNVQFNFTKNSTHFFSLTNTQIELLWII
jgi:hypothetical protein